MNNLLSNLTVNILTYRTNQEILKNCIMSIDKTVRINIIENSNELKNQEFYKKLNPNIEVFLTGENLGYARGHNFGLQKVKTKYALILNPDLICKDNYFKNGENLLIWVQKMSGQIKIRPDHKLFLQKKIKSRDDKINEVVKLIDQIESINN
jgi:hypothetical protein